MESNINISKIFRLERELLRYQQKEQKDALSSIKRSENQAKEDIDILKVLSSLFRKITNEDSIKRGKEEVIEELLTYFKALEESKNEDLLIEYLDALDEDRLKKLYGIELNKYNLKAKIEIYHNIASDPNMLSTNQIMVKYYMPTKENLTGALKLISDIIAALEQLKSNEPNKNKIN
ncbi:MAG: hypothetical protein RXR32_00400 [Candidatus Micrarchaeota archaeon]